MNMMHNGAKPSVSVIIPIYNVGEIYYDNQINDVFEILAEKHFSQE